MALYKGNVKIAGIGGPGFNPGNTGTDGQVLTKTSSGYCYQDAPVTSVNSNTGAVTLNDVKVSASEPSNPTQGMVRYDTTNNALKTYDGTNRNSAGGGGGGGGGNTYCLDVLVVGGGGGGNCSSPAAGAGGGAVIECLQYGTDETCFPVVIGCAVACNTQGCDSCFGSNPGTNGFLAYGGGKPYSNGGSGGGGGGVTHPGAPCDRRFGNSGGFGNKLCRCGDQGYGGGGGAGGPGGHGVFEYTSYGMCPVGGLGGRGMFTIIDGRACEYAAGGAGCNCYGGPGCVSKKYYGTGGSTCSVSGCYCGCPGVVLVRYPVDGGYGFSCATGGSVTSKEICGCCYCIHTFTSDGNFCIVS